MSKTLRKSKHMQNLFHFIENNMSENLEAYTLSNVGFVSTRKLYYDFYSASGHSVNEYIRKRRLSNALSLIKVSDMGFEEIA